MLVKVWRTWNPHTLLVGCEMEHLLWKTVWLSLNVKHKGAIFHS